MKSLVSLSVKLRHSCGNVYWPGAVTSCTAVLTVVWFRLNNQNYILELDIFKSADSKSSFFLLLHWARLAISTFLVFMLCQANKLLVLAFISMIQTFERPLSCQPPSKTVAVVRQWQDSCIDSMFCKIQNCSPKVSNMLSQRGKRVDF